MTVQEVSVVYLQRCTDILKIFTSHTRPSQPHTHHAETVQDHYHVTSVCYHCVFKEKLWNIAKVWRLASFDCRGRRCSQLCLRSSRSGFTPLLFCYIVFIQEKLKVMFLSSFLCYSQLHRCAGNWLSNVLFIGPDFHCSSSSFKPEVMMQLPSIKNLCRPPGRFGLFICFFPRRSTGEEAFRKWPLLTSITANCGKHLATGNTTVKTCSPSLWKKISSHSSPWTAPGTGTVKVVNEKTAHAVFMACHNWFPCSPVVL